MAYSNPFKSLLGAFTPQQPDPYQSLLGDYYDPKREALSWLGGNLAGVGMGLASGKPGAWAVGGIQGGQNAIEDYRKQAVAGYAMNQRKQEYDYQQQQREEAAAAKQAQEEAQAAWLANPGDKNLFAKAYPTQYASQYAQTLFPGQAEGFTLGPGQVRYGPGGQLIAEGPPKEENPDNNPFQNGTKLRKEYMDETKPFTDLRTNYQKITASSQDTTGASDIALVYSFMKMLDPTSVVREGEFATAANAGGVDARVMSLYNSALNGQKLSPQIRQEFVQQAGRQFEAQAQTYQQIKKKYEGMAQEYGLDPALVAPDITYGVQTVVEDPLGVR